MNKNTNKVIIFSAPSGAGKSTIVRHLLGKFSFLEFSISATSRAPRGSEQDGIDYYFLTPERFRKLITTDSFIEYEEVYSGSFYGTLRSEIERIWNKGHIILFDIDVKGGVNLKKIFGDNALSVFVRPPSIDILRQRLVGRGTDSPEAIEKRIGKAEEELAYEKYFDVILVNDILERALSEAEDIINHFTNKQL